ncbi:hypothetical protein SKAU_G00094730 [Synaphobranchus kaupii]|uniref:Uncharacterized protein n=1 Tax=Synaphobranchus kaupii TaxID=118154 RepID=A0A9Q1FY96_SYNKA|nr:hypothetical protein SKAU_G00094730 [Synaphobranchus kaupii]
MSGAVSSSEAKYSGSQLLQKRCLGNAGRWAQPSGARKPSRGDADSSSDRATIEGTLDDLSPRRPKELFRERDCLGTNNAER